MKGDLHVHTNISDSSYNSEETLNMAKENGVTHIGIVNHDTVKGLKEIVDLGIEKGIKVIPGVEISAYDFIHNRKVHLLGYNFNLEGINIRGICEPLLEKRNANSIWQINTLLKDGYEIDIDYIAKKSKNSGVIYKQHIMDALIDKHYTDKIYSDLYRRLFKNAGICANDIEYIDIFKALDAIKRDGGIAIIAHPGQLNSYDIIPELVSRGLDGVEIYHHSHSEEDIRRIRVIGERYGLILTGGTDYHGNYGDSDLRIGDIESPGEFLQVF
ncbi:PHP domain-containing protein [Clostridium paraputrificum]|uniref:PHP domain-containing protein n=1 Tax=Clostridium paraputrificum TaxID=29363 RepID=UPI003D3323D5